MNSRTAVRPDQILVCCTPDQCPIAGGALTWPGAPSAWRLAPPTGSDAGKAARVADLRQVGGMRIFVILFLEMLLNYINNIIKTIILGRGNGLVRSPRCPWTQTSAPVGRPGAKRVAKRRRMIVFELHPARCALY